MNEKKSDISESDQSPLDSFNKKLQDVVIQQAQRMINYDLYVKALLSTLPVALIATDKNGRIKTVNKTTEEILNLNLKELKDIQLTKFFDPNTELVEKMTETLTEGKQFHLNSKEINLTKDRQIVANIYIQPIRD